MRPPVLHRPAAPFLQPFSPRLVASHAHVPTAEEYDHLTAPLSDQREAWVTGVRSLTGRNKHRIWAPHVALDPPPLLADVSVILVSPKRPTSVGSVARSLSCFECIDLRIVAPRCDHLSRAARNGSKGAQYLLWRAAIYPTLEDALHGIDVSVAFTRWIDDGIGSPQETFWSVTELMASQRVALSPQQRRMALVFGREVEGLRAGEINQCSALCSIPIGRLQESLSLSHAVTLALAPMFDSRQRALRSAGHTLASVPADLAPGVEVQDD